MTAALRSKIHKYIKNNLDIAELLEGVEIHHENLSGAIITKLVRVCENLDNINFSYSVIGQEGGEVNLSGSSLKNCNFKAFRIKGKFIVRRCDFRGSNFAEADMINVEYQFADLRQCRFCETAMRIGSRLGLGAKFDSNLFKELAKHWGIKITMNDNSEVEHNE